MVIYPSDCEAAIELAKSKNVNDKFGFSAVRINFAGKKEPKNGRTVYYPFEIFLDEERKWQRVTLKFMNLTHVGKVSPLEERAKGQVQNIALLFKGNYTYKRLKSMPNGAKVEVTENYGAVKEWLCKAFMAHVRRYQQKHEQFDDAAKVIPNVKTERKEKDKNGKFVMVPISPSNINVNIPFAGEESDASKKDPKTKFKCPILDITRQKKGFNPKSEWPFEDARARYTVVTDAGKQDVEEELNNGNIHRFLRGGSLITGFDSMSDICVSAMGISLPSKVDVIFVKQSAPQRFTANNFSQDDWDSIAGAKAPDDPKLIGENGVPIDTDFGEELTATPTVNDSGDGFDTTAGDELNF